MVITKVLILAVQRKTISANKEIIFGFLKWALPACLLAAYIAMQARHAFPLQTDTFVKGLLVLATGLALWAMFDARFSNWVNRQSGTLGECSYRQPSRLNGRGRWSFCHSFDSLSNLNINKNCSSGVDPHRIGSICCDRPHVESGRFCFFGDPGRDDLGAVVAIPLGILAVRLLPESWVRWLVISLISLALLNSMAALIA